MEGLPEGNGGPGDGSVRLDDWRPTLRERPGSSTASAAPGPPAPPARRWSWKDLVGVAWVMAAGVGVLLPALIHGLSLGSYDLLGQYGVTAHPGTPHNGLQVDVIDQMIPWTALTWTQVHAGVLPLWNPGVLNGTPLAFNWQSSAFSLPALVSYLVPLRLAYTCQVLLTLWIAGTGAYVAARSLRLGVLGAVFAGVVFELGGPFVSWLGWPVASVVAWSGWIVAGVLAVLAGRHRARAVVGCGVACAGAVLAGQPDALILVVLATVVFAVVSLGVRWWQVRRPAALVRPVVDLAAAAVLGGLLSAPLLLPGLQLLSGSVRAGQGQGGLDAQHALDPRLVLNGYALGLNGAPNVFDFQYLGVAAVVLAVGVVVLRRRQDWVVALAVVALLGGLLAFVNPVDQLVNALPGLHPVRLPRAVLALGFATALLGGAGLQLLTTTRRVRALRWFGALFAIAAAALVVVWATGYRRVVGFDVLTAPSYLWPAALLLVGLGCVAAGVPAVRRGVPGGRPDPGAAQVRRVAAVALVMVETAFLVAAGSHVWTSSSDSAPAPPSAAARQLAAVVGDGLVGLGAPLCTPGPGQLGFAPNTNLLYGVRQYAAYDPLLPQRLYDSWQASTGQAGGYPQFSHFCPGITSVAIARHYGVSYVLEPPGTAGPAGTARVATVAGEGVYRVPGVAEATVTPTGATGVLPADSAPSSPVAVGHPDPATWQVRLDGDARGRRARLRTGTEVLRLRLTDVPGWHATADGRPLALYAWDGALLQAVVPAGTRQVTLRYRPQSFDVGLVLAVVGALGALAALTWGPLGRRRPG